MCCSLFYENWEVLFCCMFPVRFFARIYLDYKSKKNICYKPRFQETYTAFILCHINWWFLSNSWFWRWKQIVEMNCTLKILFISVLDFNWQLLTIIYLCNDTNSLRLEQNSANPYDILLFGGMILSWINKYVDVIVHVCPWDETKRMINIYVLKSRCEVQSNTNHLHVRANIIFIYICR